jgi:hypothetical protein
MKKQLIYTHRLLLFVIAVLFSLTPCKVKASLFESFDATYQQTLNQSKIGLSCANGSLISQKSVSINAVKVEIPNFFVAKNNFYFEKKVAHSKFSTAPISVQFPPKYILYKRFKFDIV